MDRAGYTMAELATAVGGELLCGEGKARFAHLAIDSRKPFHPEGTLFIALKGERHDAHRYLPELVEHGVRCFLVSDADTLPDREGLHAVRVTDTLDALQRLVAWHRGHHHGPVVGITGSNGKTIVKEWLFQCLRGTTHVVRSPGSWNSQVGVPLSVWELGPEHELGIFEAGISRPGEMERLRPIVAPTIGIFTTIGPAHGENFPDDTTKALEKAKLFTNSRALVYCRDHAAVHAAVLASGLDKQLELLDWSRERSGYVHVSAEEHHAEHTVLRLLHDHEEGTYRLPFTDKASVENALHVITLLLHLGHSPEWIAERVRGLTPVAMRLETLDGIRDTTLIDDSYSNDLASLTIALDHLVATAGERPRMVVLSDVAESAEAPARLYERVGSLLKRAQVEHFIGVGPAITAHARHFPEHSRFVPDADALLHDGTTPPDEAVVLVKGARSFALERLVKRWERQAHGTVLEVDLGAVRHNLNHYRARLKPGTRLMAMVKAFGYGSGALELARLFAHERVDYLGVAYADEGIELRQNGIRTPVLVMNPEPVPLELLHRFRLEAEIYDRRTLEEAIHYHAQVSDAPPVHLKIDTGMHRLGFTVDELPWLCEQLQHAPQLRVASIFSHLAAADDPAHDGFTRQQIADFTAAANRISEVLGYWPLRHIANSPGITRFPEAHFDMVRLGVGMHGIGVDAAQTAQLLPAHRLSTPIAQLKDVPAEDSIGYGRSYRASAPLRIATLPIGYADGLPRRLGNGHGRVYVHGRPAPFVGSICMDMCMVDVTGIPCEAGDAAVVFDAAHPVQQFAEDLGTIPYEALTSISQRVKRVYVWG